MTPMGGETPSGTVCACSTVPAPPAARRISNPLVLLGLGVTTACVLASQLVLARFLGAAVGYYFAFVLVSFAMLGLASAELAPCTSVSSPRCSTTWEFLPIPASSWHPSRLFCGS